MGSRCALVLSLCVAALATTGCFAPATKWRGTLQLGTSHNFETPLTIKQDGEEDIDVNHARYHTRPWSEAPYYGARLTRWSGDEAWEIEFLHHKIKLRNGGSDVQYFEVSNGYGLLMVNYARDFDWAIGRIGAGVIVAYPISRVRGRAFDEDGGLFDSGYFLAGPCAQVGLEKTIDLGAGFHLSLEGKLTYGYAEVEIAGGDASVPNLAIHGLIGFGYDF